MNPKLTILIWTLCLVKLSGSHPTQLKTEEPSGLAITSREIAEARKASEDLVSIEGYRRAAIENGMDPDAVVEVLRTGKPFVKVENESDDKGEKRITTTYTLQADGTVSRHIRTEFRSVHSNTPFTVKATPSAYSQPLIRSRTQKATDWEWNPTNIPRVGEPPNRSDAYPNFHFPYGQSPQYWHSQGIPTQTNTRSGIDTEDAGTVTKTFADGDNTKITTVHTVGPTHWQTKTVTTPWYGFDPTKATTTKRPENLPSLDDFLKTQYTTTSKSTVPQNPHVNSAPRPVTKININDLPITEIISTGEPQNEHGFKTETKTYTRTIQTNGGAPTVSELSPHMKDILEKAGIDPHDALAVEDGTITKTRREPDGKIITTTYRISTVPAAETNTVGRQSPNVAEILGNELPQGPFVVQGQPKPPHSFPPIKPKTISRGHRDFEAEKTFGRDWQATVPQQGPSKHASARPTIHKNPIDEFLAQFNMTTAQLATSNGEILKQIIDENGRVLTASFVLSTVRNDGKPSRDKAEAPLK